MKKKDIELLKRIDKILRAAHKHAYKVTNSEHVTTEYENLFLAFIEGTKFMNKLKEKSNGKKTK